MSDENPPPDPAADPPAPPAPEATLTQSQVDAIVAREKAKATKTAEKAAAEAIAAAKTEADKAAMGEAERARAEAAEITAAANALRAEAATERLAAKVERRLLAAGVPEQALTRASRMVSLEADASDEDIEAEITAVREAVPTLFAKSPTGDGTPPAPPKPGTPPKPPTGGQGTATVKEMAHARLLSMGITPRSESAA